MTTGTVILLILLVGMVYLFLTEKIPVDLTAFLGLVIMVLTGMVTPSQAFTGFASSAVITMLSVFMLSAALLNTGVADSVGGRVHALVGSNETLLIITVMLVAGILSAFMNNVAATAVLMPAIGSIARRAGIAPSRLFMPLAFGAILGGTTTLVGTPPNILAAEALKDQGLEPFSLFEFTPMGCILLGVGILYMITVGRRLLPSTDIAAHDESKDLAQVYQLHDHLFSVRIPPDSSLDGVTLGESRFGARLGIEVVAILRNGKRRLAPTGRSVLRGGDVLLVEGRQEDLQDLVQVRGVEIETADSGELPRRVGGVSGARARLVDDSRLMGRSLRDLRFRDEFGVVVVGIVRGDEILRTDLGRESLQKGDEILALGTEDDLERFAAREEFTSVRAGLSAVQQLQDSLFLIGIPEDSPLVGSTMAESRIGELVGITVGGVIRGGETRLAVAPDEVIKAGDRFLVSGEPSRVLDLLQIGEIQLEPTDGELSLESEEVGVVEATLSPRSGIAGRTLADLDFRARHGLQVLSVWREGEPHHDDLARFTLRLGDAFLLQGPREKIQALAHDPDFLILSQDAHAPRRYGRAPVAIGGLFLMILMVVTGWQPISVAAFTAATFVVLFGALRMEEAYQVIEWRAVFLVAAILPVGAAMDSTGTDTLLASSVTAIASNFGSHAALAAMIFLASLLSQGLDGAPAVVLLAPVAAEAASQLGIRLETIMMAISLAASAAFMTPFSHKANLLVMGAGGYRTWDYVKVGTPLTVVVLALLVLLVPVLFPF